MTASIRIALLSTIALLFVVTISVVYVVDLCSTGRSKAKRNSARNSSRRPRIGLRRHRIELLGY